MVRNSPLKMVLIAPFCAGLGPRGRAPLRASEGQLGAAARALGENCVLEISQQLLADGRIAVPLLPPDGFEPDVWLSRTAPLAELLQISEYLLRAENEQTDADEVAAQLTQRWPQKKGSWVAYSSKVDAATTTDPLAVLFDLVELPKQLEDETHARRGGALIWRNEVEDELSSIMQHIVNQPAYGQRVKAWQGAGLLVQAGHQAPELLLVDSSIEDLSETLKRIESELETFGPDLLLVDLPLGCTPRDQALLAQLAALAEGLLAPLLVGVEANFLGLSSWAELGQLPYLKNHFEQAIYAKWRALQKKSSAQWLSVLVGGFGSGEDKINSEALSQPLKLNHPQWQNPVWLAAMLVVQRYQTGAFLCPISGENLGPGSAKTLQIELAFSVDRYAQLVQVGIAPILEVWRGQPGLAAVPTLGGGTLDQQLFLRQLLAWLFIKQDTRPRDDAATLDEELRRSLIQAGVTLPADLDLHEEDGLLILRLTPPPELVAAGELIDLQLPWK